MKQQNIKEYFLYLMERYDSDTLTDKEREDYRRLSVEMELVREERVEAAWSSVSERYRRNKKRRGILKLTSRVAAAAVVVGVAITLYTTNRGEGDVVVASKPLITQAAKTINLDEVHIITPKGDVQNIDNKIDNVSEIVATISEQPVVEPAKEQESVEVAKYEIIVPRGSDYNLTLPDGSTVWLAPNSRFSFPEVFTNSREVSVEGEAIFDVVRDEKRPFIVKTDDMNINVLGTMFYVSAIKDSKNSETALIRGSVEVQISGTNLSTVLKPSTMAEYSKGDGQLMVKDVDTSRFLKLLEGELYFNNEPLGVIAERIERFYNITIQFEDDSLKSKRFYGSLEVDSSYEELLKLLSETEAFSYTVKGDTVTIK